MLMRSIIDDLITARRRDSFARRTFVKLSDAGPGERGIVMARFRPYLQAILTWEALKMTGEIHDFSEIDPDEVMFFSPDFGIDGLNRKTLSRAEIHGEYSLKPEFLFKVFPNRTLRMEKSWESPGQVQEITAVCIPVENKELIEHRFNLSPPPREAIGTDNECSVVDHRFLIEWLSETAAFSRG